MNKQGLRPKNVDEYLALEALGTLLSMFNIKSSEDVLEVINYCSGEFVCVNCEYMKDDCVCDDADFHGRYNREYDDE